VRKRWLLWRTLLGLALGLALLAWLLRGSDLRQAWAGLTQARSLWVSLSLLVTLLTMAGKVARWRALFPSAPRPSWGLLVRALLVGQVTNALLPARAGDVARACVAGAGGQTSRMTALGTVAAEKAFDVIFLLLGAGLAALLTPLPPWLTGGLAGMAAVGGLLFVLAVALPESRTVDWADRWGRRLPWGVGSGLGERVRRGLDGLVALRRPRTALVACAWSVPIWALSVATNYLLFFAFDLRLSLGAALFLLVLLLVGVAPPSSPARVGVFHALAVVGLATFGIEGPVALAYATVLHLIVYLPQIVLGVVAAGWLPVRRREQRDG